MDKLSIFKGRTQNFREGLRMNRNLRMSEYNDKFLQKNSGQKMPFKHSWALMAHMHDLRMWTLAYSPSRSNNLQRMQEIHRLNAEMNYGIADAIGKRILYLIAFWFLVTKIFPRKYMNQGNFDSHDASWRDSPAHMWEDNKKY